MKLKFLGIFGIISLLSYTAMVVLSPLAYPGYDWLSCVPSSLWCSLPLAAGKNSFPLSVIGQLDVLPP